MRKQTAVIGLILALALSFSGCGGTDGKDNADTGADKSKTEDSQGKVPADGKEQSNQYEFKKEKLTAESGEHKVVGILFQPQTEEPCPLVIVSHGFSANYTYYVDICEELASKGIAAVAIDFYGGSKKSLSGGTMEEMTVFTEQQDLEAMIDVAKASEKIDAERIFLIGHSQGGFVSTLVAAERPEEIKGLYLIAPAYHIPDAMRAAFASYEEIHSFTQSGGTVGVPYAQAVYHYDIFETMVKYTGKVHIYHGEEDEAVDMSYSERAVETFENAELTKVPKMAHNVFDMIQSDICDEIAVDAGR